MLIIVQSQLLKLELASEAENGPVESGDIWVPLAHEWRIDRQRVQRKGCSMLASHAAPIFHYATDA